MPILNYTTKVPADKTASEIMAMLAAHGARQVMMDFGDDHQPVALKWRLETGGDSLAFSLPINVDKVFEVLTRQRVLTNSPDRRREQAQRTAWRIVKEWVGAQLALIETEMVSMDEVFLPYMLAGERTLYQVLVENRFRALPTVEPPYPPVDS